MSYNKYLYKYLENLDLKNKIVVDIPAGEGELSEILKLNLNPNILLKKHLIVEFIKLKEI